MILELERLTLELWPPAERTRLDGWELATSRGYTRRVNSVQTWADGRWSLDRKLDRCREHFAERGLPLFLKLTADSRPTGLDAELARRGFARAGETRVMVRDLAAGAAPADPGVAIAGSLDDEWLAACTRLNQVAPGDRGALCDILDRLPPERGFARVGGPEGITSLALGSLAGGAVYLGEVVTAPAARRTGQARRVVEALLGWARERGARRAFLGVVSENAPAAALYVGLGFREAYRYWYRSPGDPA